MNKKITLNQLKEFLKINVADLDSQHEFLLDLFEKALKQKSEEENILDLILLINNCLFSHFQTEEKFMQNINYKYIDEHKKEHLTIMNEFKNILKQYIKNHDEDELNNRIKQLISNLYKTHYNLRSKDYGGDVKLINYIKFATIKNGSETKRAIGKTGEAAFEKLLESIDKDSKGSTLGIKVQSTCMMLED